jgi:ybbR-like protein
MKKTNNKFNSIVSFFDKYIINPFGKFLIIVKDKIKTISEKLDVIWSKKSSVIVISLICALLLFFVIDKRIVILSESNAEVLYGQKVKALYNEEEYIVEGLPKKVDITLIGKRWDIYLAKQYPAKEVTVDLKNLKPGIHKVKLKYEQVLKGVNYRIDPSEVTVTIRNKVSDKRALSAEIINKDKFNSQLVISEVKLSADSVIIKGSNTTLEKVATVKALIDARKLSSSKEGIINYNDVKLVAYDADGKEIDVEIVSPKITATVKLEVLSKTVPIRILTKGNLSTKAIKSIIQSDSEVKVYGSSEALSQLNYLPVEIDVTGLDSNKKYTVNLQKPKGITDISIKTITVDISVDDLATKTVDGITINYRNLADDLVVQGVNDESRTISVEVRGTKENLDKIDKATIQAYVDLSGKGVGVHELDVSVEGDDQKLSYVSKIKKIKVNIYKKDS